MRCNFWTMTMGKILEQTPRKMNCSNVNKVEFAQEWSLVEWSFPSPLDLIKHHILSTESTLDPFLGHPLFCPIDNFDRCLGQKYLIDRSTSAKHGATREHKKKRIGPHLPRKRRINKKFVIWYEKYDLGAPPGDFWMLDFFWNTFLKIPDGIQLHVNYVSEIEG